MQRTRIRTLTATLTTIPEATCARELAKFEASCPGGPPAHHKRDFARRRALRLRRATADAYARSQQCAEDAQFLSDPVAMLASIMAEDRRRAFRRAFLGDARAEIIRLVQERAESVATRPR